MTWRLGTLAIVPILVACSAATGESPDGPHGWTEDKVLGGLVFAEDPEPAEGIPDVHPCEESVRDLVRSSWEKGSVLVNSSDFERRLRDESYRACAGDPFVSCGDGQCAAEIDREGLATRALQAARSGGTLTVVCADLPEGRGTAYGGHWDSDGDETVYLDADYLRRKDGAFWVWRTGAELDVAGALWHLVMLQQGYGQPTAEEARETVWCQEGEWPYKTFAYDPTEHAMPYIVGNLLADWKPLHL